MLKWVVSQGRSLVLMATPRLRIRIILVINLKGSAKIGLGYEVIVDGREFL